MDENKLRRWAYITVCAAGAGVLLYVGVRYLFGLALPFLFAWAAAFTVRPLAERLSRLTHISPRVLRVLLTVLFIFLAAGVLGVLLWQLAAEAWALLTGFGEAGEGVRQALAVLMHPLDALRGATGESGTLGEDISGILAGMITAALTELAGFLSRAVTGIPRVLIFLLVTVIASVYFSLDLDRINRHVRAVLPPRVTAFLVRFRAGFFRTGGRYLRSYAILMLVTFVIILSGLLILRVPYSVLLAVIIALLDALPVIGVGTVLLPWALYELLVGRISFGVGLIFLFIIHEVIRQFIEPRIVGHHLGIHPIATLIFLFVGYSLFGVPGFLLVPVFTVVFRILTDREEPPAAPAAPQEGQQRTEK